MSGICAIGFADNVGIEPPKRVEGNKTPAERYQLAIVDLAS
jgi:hypothetical protein